jgi:hypothetical protein
MLMGKGIKLLNSMLYLNIVFEHFQCEFAEKSM